MAIRRSHGQFKKDKKKTAFRTIPLLVSLALGTASVSNAMAAHTIKGTVTNEQGQPISNAKIELHGTRIQITTDNKGQFVVNETANHVDELHVSAKGYNHQSVSIDQQTQTLNVVLSPAVIERIHVTATPLHGSTLESATPISVISDLDLKNKHSSTLGETLKGELGVHSTYYGPVSSTPIIRGLDGPRVLIAQNGLDVGDASRVGPDHVVATETSTVKQVEVLRGPATLFYGSGAIGGVVNVVDNRIPQFVEDKNEAQVSYSDVSDQAEFSTDLNGGFELDSGAQIAWHIDAFYRDSSDFKVPENPSLEDDHHNEHEHEDLGHEEREEHRDEHDEHGDFTIENSGSEAHGFTLGTSYLFENGYLGVSIGQLNRLYGIPGHAHEDEHGDEQVGEGEAHHDEHGHDEHEEEGVKGDMSQTRFQMIGEWQLDNKWFTGINGRLALTDYEHKEIEDGEVGTVFENDSWQIRSDLLLADMNDWHGALSFDAKGSDFVAIGAEAFAPPSKTSSFAVGLLEEKHFGGVLVQLGARFEHVEIEYGKFENDHHEEEHEHDEHHDDEHAHEHISFTPFSISAGLVYDFAKGYNVALSYTLSSRAPSASELLAFGPHIGTNSYEIGAAYHHEEDGHHEEHEGEHHDELVDLDEVFHFEPDHLKEETSKNLELSLRKFEGDKGFVINAFYNEVDDFYYQENTGLFFTGDIHGHEGETQEEHAEHAEEGLPVYHFVARDAEFYGIEAQYVWRVNSAMKLAFQADSISGKLTTGEYLPRIPPMRFGAKLNYDWVNTSLELSAMHNFEQDKVAELETHTEGYTMVDLRLNHTVNLGRNDLDLFLKIDNVFDEAARVHTSFLKNDTLLPGRNIALGARVYF